MSEKLFERHRETLEKGVEATRNRRFWSPYPEVPSKKIYGETGHADGRAAFEARLGHAAAIALPDGVQTGESSAAETSPYGKELGVTYPVADPARLVAASAATLDDWAGAGIRARAGVLLEALHRLNRRSFEMAYATMHTTGQGFVMAFQAGGPHAQDRGLEALALAYREIADVPESVVWEKQVGRTEIVRLVKRFHVRPRGVSLAIGCSTFPTWNSYPGMFASLAAGNPVIVKPHPGSILPLAMTVEIMQEVLREEGYDPNVVTLAIDGEDGPVAKGLATDPAVKIVDYTGGSPFGSWLEESVSQADVYTEKAGINAMVIDGVEDLDAVADNIAFGLSLYSGQMCTATQNVFVPRHGIETASGRKSYEEVAEALTGAIDRLLEDPVQAAGILGCIKSDDTLARIDAAATDGGTVLRPSAAIPVDGFPDARCRSPLVMEAPASQRELYMREMFGPISYIVPVSSAAAGLELLAEGAREHGAITAGVHARDRSVLDSAERIAVAAGVPLSCNLTGQIWVNQAAAFSDYHVSGLNPAGNATLCDASFVASRFRVTQSREPHAES